MSDPQDRAPKEWTGRFFEDFDVGDVFHSRLGRTVLDADNVWFTCLTLNTNQMHFNDEYARQSRFGRQLVNSTLTLALVTGLSVPDVSENAVANLSWEEIILPKPVFVGDTLWAETQILDVRESRSNDEVGIVKMKTRGINQRRETVIEFRRTIMIGRRGSGAAPRFPSTDDPWQTGD